MNASGPSGACGLCWMYLPPMYPGDGLFGLLVVEGQVVVRKHGLLVGFRVPSRRPPSVRLSTRQARVSVFSLHPLRSPANSPRHIGHRV